MDTQRAQRPDTRRRASHPRERCETAIIGAGQAGLSVAYHLAQRGRTSVLLDRHSRVGDNWRRHWDSLRLYSPARYCGLPGSPFPADGWTFPTKDQVADYLEDYAERFGFDVRAEVNVESVERQDEHYLIRTDGIDVEADNVVVTTGTFGGPHRPAFAADLDPDIVQLHSSEYRRPTQLRTGPVLVVGASHSGADIAMEAAQAGGHEPTVLCGPSHGQIPFQLEGRLTRTVFPLVWLIWGHLLNIRTPAGRKMRQEERDHGGPLLRYRQRDLEAAGVERVTERVVGVHDGRPVLEGGRVVDADNVIWCTGFHQDFSWIDPPVTGDDGWPREERGVVASSPGLYFSGLAFQSSFRSMLIGGAGHDAEHVARHLDARSMPNGSARSSRRAGEAVTPG